MLATAGAATTVSDRYPNSHLHDFSSALHDSTFFSKLDLVKAYHHIPVTCTDYPTPFGLYEFVRMTFGLKNAAQTFQKFIARI